MRRRGLYLCLVAVVVLSAVLSAGRWLMSERTVLPGRWDLSPESLCPAGVSPTTPPLPYGDDARIVHYSDYPYSDGFTSVTALRDGTVYAAGSRETPPVSSECLPQPGPAFIRQWDGKQWRELPALDAMQEPHYVAASAAGRVWMVGDCPDAAADTRVQTCVGSWDGASWATRWLGTDEPPLGAVAFGNEFWTGSASTLHQWDGARWRERKPPFAVRLLAGHESGRLWIAGNQKGVLTLARWTGQEWRLAPRPPIPHLYGDKQGETLAMSLSVGDRGEVWVLGSMFWRCGQSEEDEETLCTRRLLMKWDGARWTFKVMPEDSATGDRIVSDGADGVWMRMRDDLGHFTGQTWKTYRITEGPLGRSTMLTLARSPGSRVVWGVGRDEKGSRVNGVIWRLVPDQ